MKYEIEQDTECGYMDASRDELAEAVVGHRIKNAYLQQEGYYRQFVLELDNGRKVILQNTDDCCAYTELDSFLINVRTVDHIITGVGTTDGFETWHIYADMGDVLQLNVSWSAGNPCYYGYGFNVIVRDLDD